MARLSEYHVYTPSRRSIYVSLTPPGRGWYEDRQSTWRLTVRAHSRAQALYLAGERIASDGEGLGIVAVRPPDPEAWEV